MDLEVIGHRVFCFDDDATAAFVNSDDALVEWNSIFIDRYDVRHLLSIPLPPRRRRQNNQGCHSLSPPQPPPDLSFEVELDQERYLDLPLQSDEQEVDNGIRREDCNAYRAVGLSYGNFHDSSEQKHVNVELDYPGFCPPFPIPESLLQNLPPSEKVHQIIAKTAIFVSKHGGQSEIVLRVKHGDNPTFGFLMPHHHLHAYFRFLVDNKEILKLDADGKPQEHGNGDAAGLREGGALSLLGSVYGSGEDEDGAIKDASEFIESHSVENPKSAIPNGSEQTCVSSVSVSGTATKHHLYSKEKPPLSKSHTDVGTQVDSLRPTSDVGNKAVTFPIPGTTKEEALILEPTADTKRVIDKIVEFILRNGRDFEAVLIEQDRKHGRFPFLLPSNAYHPFYLKALQKTPQMEKAGPAMHADDDDTASMGDGSDHDADKKEKFKMVIPKSRKETADRPSKPCRQQFSVDAASAAAILQAATRGIKNPSLEFLPKVSSNGSSAVNPDKNGDPSSISIGEPSHSSESPTTKEQKRKAERLKRAKMFAAMIRNGAEPLKIENSSVSVGLTRFEKSERRSNRKYRSRTVEYAEDEDKDKEDLDKYMNKSSKEKKRKHHRRRRHKHGDSCSDESGGDGCVKRGKMLEKGREWELEEGEISTKVWGHSCRDDSPDVLGTGKGGEASEDLRAKVRAMLATL